MSSPEQPGPQHIRTPAFSSRATVEAYLAAQVMPRWMERLREIHDELAAHRVRLGRAYCDLAEACTGDAETFERRWRQLAAGWNFGYLNDLIEQHNDYYPIEANLPVDPRTGDYVTLTGRSYEREPVGAEWVLELFPPASPAIPGG
jgi:hypothetical protein